MDKGLPTYEIVKIIHQIAADAYDGSDKKVGLQREKGHPILDPRVIDGFRVKVGGNLLTIAYQSQSSGTEVENPNYKNKIHTMINQIAQFLRREFKKETGVNLRLKDEYDEPNVLVQFLSRSQCWVEAHMCYRISNIEELNESYYKGVKPQSLEKVTREIIKEQREENYKRGVTASNLWEEWLESKWEED